MVSGDDDAITHLSNITKIVYITWKKPSKTSSKTYLTDTDKAAESKKAINVF